MYPSLKKPPPTMATGPASAFLYPFRGLRLITRAGYRRYSAIPLLINAALFAGLGALLFGQLDGWVDALLPPGGWHDYVRWLVWPVAVVAFLLVGYFTFTLVGNVIAAPFNDLLAAKVVATGGVPGTAVSIRGLTWQGVLTSVGDELRKLWFVASRSLPALLLFLIPGVNVAAPLVWFVVGSWLLAFEYLDYPFAETGTRFADQRRLLRRELLTTVSFGAGVSALMLIPGLNLAAIPASVAGACLLWQERWREPGARTAQSP
jgi:CysZ protein